MKNIVIAIILSTCSTITFASPIVYFFLQTECPLSQQYIKNINELYLSYGDKFKMYSVFSVPDDSDEKIKIFVKKYGLTVPIINDKNFNLTDSLYVTVTPQVVIVDDNGNILYTGPIDNRVVKLGQYRNVVDKKYVEEDLELLLQGKPFKYNQETPIGCIIEAH